MGLENFILETFSNFNQSEIDDCFLVAEDAKDPLASIYCQVFTVLYTGMCYIKIATLLAFLKICGGPFLDFAHFFGKTFPEGAQRVEKILLDIFALLRILGNVLGFLFDIFYICGIRFIIIWSFSIANSLGDKLQKFGFGLGISFAKYVFVFANLPIKVFNWIFEKFVNFLN